MSEDQRISAASAPSARRRDARIDALRGLALMGILVVNLPFFAMPYGFAGGWWRQADTLHLGTVSAYLIQALFENKFILIFAFLFGMGAAGQIASAGRRKFVMRMAVLAVLGVLNAIFVFEADILLPYAILGLVMLPALRWSTRTLLTVAGLLWALAILDHALFGLYVATATPEPGLSEAARITLFRDGGVLAIAQQRMQDWFTFSQMSIPMLWPMTASAFCLGIVAFRRKDVVLATGDGALEAIARGLVWPALAGNLVYGALCLAPSDWAGGNAFLVTLVLRPVFAPLLSFVLFVGLMALFSRPRWAGLRDFFAASGRMSMSLYMLQGLVGSLLFCGYGAGLYGHVSLQWVFAFSVLLFLVLAMLAATWSARFGAGPLEMAMARILSLLAPRPHSPEPTARRAPAEAGPMRG
ncbi:DUF418 domain-containing protein [Azorhizobium sp. AG788]|uniref:DUF418 domain-containing protein n=1 Tax=Azorhizobium sp. AG788 TaxID=2183897 RepID=UPI003138FD9D